MGKTVKDRNYSFKHTKVRLKERYDIDITEDDYNHLCKKIETGADAKVVMIECQKGDEQITYDILFHYKGVIRVVWSKTRGYITTALKR